MKDEAMLGARLCDRVRAFRVHYPGDDIVVHLGIQSTAQTIGGGDIKQNQVSVDVTKIVDTAKHLEKLLLTRYVNVRPEGTRI